MRILARSAQQFSDPGLVFTFQTLQCPYCKGRTGCEAEIVRCSACRTQYHKECWFDNQGCSVFGCNGALIKARGFSIPVPFLGTRVRIFEDPKWLMILRFIVFGFYPCIEVVSGFETSFVFTMFSILIGVWAVLFMFIAPVLFILEFACWWIVYEDPTLQERFGKESNHIASLALYGSAVAFLILSLFI